MRLRKLLPENIKMTAYEMGGTMKKRFESDAANNADINLKIHHLHKWVRSTGTPLHVLAVRPDGTTHAGNIHPDTNPPYVNEEAEIINLNTYRKKKVFSKDLNDRNARAIKQLDFAKRMNYAIPKPKAVT